MTLFCQFIFANQTTKAPIQFPEFILEGIVYEIELDQEIFNDSSKVQVNGIEKKIQFDGDQPYFEHEFQKDGEFELIFESESFQFSYQSITLWWSLLPPLIAIILALVFKEVVSSLIIGLFAGCAIIHVSIHGVFGFLYAFLEMLDTYILGALEDRGHLSIIIFSTLIGGMVAIISKNGGMQGVVNKIARFAHDAKTGQLATWFLGIAIFFDDYANTLIVGNTMRPLTDKLKISREKLAYLVDSTAAPMASIAFITTWIGAELGYIGSGIEQIEGLDEGVYATFIASLKYSFYPILSLIFMLSLILKGRDFGPMLKAEQKARNQNNESEHHEKTILENSEFKVKEGVKSNALQAIIPVLVVIFGTIAGLLYTGYNETIINDPSLSFFKKLSSTIGDADSYSALLWASCAGIIAAIKLSVLSKKLSLGESIESALHGFRSMLPAIVILVLAWSLAGIIEDLHTANLLTSILEGQVSAELIPAITFVLAAIVAFSTGSSWGTMAILYPLMLPASWEISQASGLDYASSLSLFHNTVACVLAGAVLGDHCSPISDTTILSSMASSCRHIDHVRTQMPYALTVGIVSILFGIIPASFGMPFWLTFSFSITSLILIIHFFGKPSHAESS